MTHSPALTNESQAAVCPRNSRAALIAGWVLSALPVMFLSMNGVIHIMQIPDVIKISHQMGYPPEAFRTWAFVLFAAQALFLYPRTALLGAVLLTGYLGGAVAIHVRINDPLFSHTLFPIYVAVFIWLGLWLRDSRLRNYLLGR